MYIYIYAQARTQYLPVPSSLQQASQMLSRGLRQEPRCIVPCAPGRFPAMPRVSSASPPFVSPRYFSQHFSFTAVCDVHFILPSQKGSACRMGIPGLL